MRLAPTTFAVLLMLLTGCSGSEQKSSSATLPGEAAVGTSAGGVPAGQGGGDLPAGRAIILTGDVAVRVDDVRVATNALRERISGVGGYLAGSDIALDSDRPSADLTFRVPVDRYDEAVTAAGETGTLLSQHANTEDVTAQVVDLEARATALEISIKRLNTFLADAGNVEDLARLEAELTTRESSLGQIRAEQRALTDKVTYATLHVRLTTSGVPAGNKVRDTGFSAGWHRGVDAIKGLARGTAAVVGFLLPFAPVAVPILVVVFVARRITRRRAKPAQLAPPNPPTGTPDS
jgi:hypothetical protein